MGWAIPIRLTHQKSVSLEKPVYLNVLSLAQLILKHAVIGIPSKREFDRGGWSGAVAVAQMSITMIRSEVSSEVSSETGHTSTDSPIESLLDFHRITDHNEMTRKYATRAHFVCNKSTLCMQQERVLYAFRI